MISEKATAVLAAIRAKHPEWRLTEEDVLVGNNLMYPLQYNGTTITTTTTGTVPSNWAYLGSAPALLTWQPQEFQHEWVHALQTSVERQKPTSTKQRKRRRKPVPLGRLLEGLESAGPERVAEFV